MPNINDLHIVISGAWGLLVLLLLGSILFTLLVYRRTNPALPRGQKVILISLRAATLFLLLLVLYETVYHHNVKSSLPPVLAVAIDNSASMSLTDNAGSRPETIATFLENPDYLSAIEGYRVIYYSFANETNRISKNQIDSSIYTGDQSNISSALQHIRSDLIKEHLTDILLVSDGNYNAGENPLRVAETSPIPIHTLGIGSIDPNADIALTKVERNPFGYVNEPTPLQLQLHSTGLQEAESRIDMWVDGELQESRQITIQQSPSEIKETFLFKPTTEGRKKIVFTVAPVKNEQTLENNSKTVYLDVLKSKLNITVLSGAVVPGLSFLKRALKANERYQIVCAVQSQPGNYYRPEPPVNFIDDTDIFVLFNFPTLSTPLALLDRIVSKVENDYAALLFWIGPNLDISKLAKLEHLLPFRANIRLGAEQQVFGNLSQSDAAHSILKFSADADLDRFPATGQLPPIFTNVRDVRLWPDTEILAQLAPLRPNKSPTRANRQLPFLATRVLGRQKSVTIFAYGVWQWSLFLASREPSFDYYAELVSNFTKWLEPDDKSQGTRLELNSQKYTLSDNIEATVTVVDNERRPVEDAEVVLKITREGIEHIENATKTRPGNFTAQFNVSRPGDYTITAEVLLDDQLSDAVTSSFTVGEYSTELAVTQLQQSMLKGISKASGGGFFQPDSIANLKQHLRRQPLTINRQFNLQLWNNSYVLIAIILLLATEWFLRKRRGLL